MVNNGEWSIVNACHGKMYLLAGHANMQWLTSIGKIQLTIRLRQGFGGRSGIRIIISSSTEMVSWVGPLYTKATNSKLYFNGSFTDFQQYTTKWYPLKR
jgi:hypothetical protein